MQKFLKDLRNEKGMTLAEVSSRTAIPSSTISHFERGSRRLNPEALAAFANLYSVKSENIIQPFVKARAKIEESGLPYRTSSHRLMKYMSDGEVEALLDKARQGKDWPTVRDLALELETRKENQHHED